MHVRTMEIGDYNEVYRLWTNTPGMGLNNVDDSIDGVGKFLRRNPTTSFVAETDRGIVGVILCGHDGRRGYIYHLAVAVDERGRGVGRALVDAALAALDAEGICKAALVVFSRNEIGNRFWERCGFGVRNDLNYRNCAIREIVRLDT